MPSSAPVAMRAWRLTAARRPRFSSCARTCDTQSLRIKHRDNPGTRYALACDDLENRFRFDDRREDIAQLIVADDWRSYGEKKFAAGAPRKVADHGSARASDVLKLSVSASGGRIIPRR